MLRALATFLVMVATSCLVFAALGVLRWQMALAVVGGSALGWVLARVALPSRDPPGRSSAQ